MIQQKLYSVKFIAIKIHIKNEGCILAIMNNIAMNLWVQVSF